jgi:hypothetical protein
MNPEENDEIMETEVDTAIDTDADEVVGDVPTIIDLVMDGKASEAKQAIYASLYQKVGERIDVLKPEIRNSINTAETPTEE